MEPRIATLLDVRDEDINTQDQVFQLTPPSRIRRPPSAQTMSIGDDTLILTHPLPVESRIRNFHGVHVRNHSFSARPNPGAPIAQVLNDEAPIYTSPPSTTAFTSSTNPFSGRLDDLLLDGWEQPNKWRKRDQVVEQPTQIALESTLIRLPELPQLPKKTTRRHRIPPLLQGLHQPPPLPPEGRLFPPITSEKSVFARNPGKSITFDAHADETRSKVDETRGVVGSYVTETKRPTLEVVEHLEHNAAPPASPLKLASEFDKGKEVQAKGRKRHNRKRNKWSQQEIRDLIVGVRRHGIGNWKRVLKDPQFTFRGRTAIDLKDRFRVCYPGDGPKTRKRKQDKITEANLDSSSISAHAPNIPNTSERIKLSNIITTETPEVDKHGPFPKSKRRPQRKFSAKDDENLLLGFERHGPVWHNMRNDPDLGFDSRHPTDLRDRFRIKYPDKYAKAGYKLKSKQVCPEEEQMSDSPRWPPQTNPNVSDSTARISYHIGRAPLSEMDAKKTPDKRNLIAPTTTSVTPNSNLRPYGIAPYLFDSTPLLLSDDAISEDEDGNDVPITLNRNILQWADANPSNTSAFPPMSTQVPNTIVGDNSLLFDDMHINPLATLQISSTPFPTLTIPTTNAQPNILSSSLLIQPKFSSDFSTSISTSLPYPPINDTRVHLSNNPRATTSNMPTSNPSMSHNVNTRTSSTIANPPTLVLPRTPNLPTIVFPHVPAASARRTMHNLPAPADLLLGMDLENSREAQAGVNLDDAASRAMS